MSTPPSQQRAKARGAYYTRPVAADFLVHWSVRSAADTVLDPSFGGGVFLKSALARLEHLGGDPAQVYGVELDTDAHQQTAYELSRLYSLSPHNLIRSDFFEVAQQLQPVDAVVGNPPFIRYQRFRGADRQLALRQAQKQGVALSQLVSSWAPFLVHSCALLKRGGRLAMVVPTELGHAAYARPVLKYLVDHFASTTLLTFRKRLFPELSQDTLLVLAEEKRRGKGQLYLHDVASAADLEPPQEAIRSLTSAEEVSPDDIISGRTTLSSYWIPAAARTLYLKLANHPATRRLGDLAEVGVGYVTGANAFFHLSEEAARAKGISASYLTPAVYRGRALSGLRFSEQDWKAAEQAGEAGFLLYLPPNKHLSEPVKAYLAEGERQAVHTAYKCRIRSPWYSVPHVHEPDAFLSYMSGLRPAFVTNQAGAVAPNSLHTVRLRADAPVSARALALRWQTSLTLLSAELEGHALGGGMLKLEPSEAKKVLVALSTETTAELNEAYATMDEHLRANDLEAALGTGDLALRKGLGLKAEECELVRQSYYSLRDRRMNR